MFMEYKIHFHSDCYIMLWCPGSGWTSYLWPASCPRLPVSTCTLLPARRPSAANAAQAGFAWNDSSSPPVVASFVSCGSDRTDCRGYHAHAGCRLTNRPWPPEGLHKHSDLPPTDVQQQHRFIDVRRRLVPLTPMQCNAGQKRNKLKHLSLTCFLHRWMDA